MGFLMALKSANLAGRFFLELGALVALGYWGFHAAVQPLAKIGLGLGTPLLAAVIWAVFVAPKASVAVPTSAWLAPQLLIFGGAAAGLAAAGHVRIAGVFGALVVLNGLLLYAWGQ